LTTQIESADETPSSWAIVGSATLAIVPSSTDSATPNVTARIAHSRRGIGSPFHSVSPTICPVMTPVLRYQSTKLQLFTGNACSKTENRYLRRQPKILRLGHTNKFAWRPFIRIFDFVLDTSPRPCK
jgi:hypothetical protein